MIKCEVLNDCAIAIKKGSIVIVDDRQYEVARKILKPFKEAKVEKVDEEVMPQKEKRKKKK